MTRPGISTRDRWTWFPALDGAETDKVAYSTGCDQGIDAGLWTINDGGHIPFFSTDYADTTTDWLFRHSR